MKMSELRQLAEKSGVPKADIKRTNKNKQPKDALIALLHNLGTASSAARQDDVDWPEPTPRATRFTVTLHKEDGQKLGFGVRRMGQAAYINEIKTEGAIVKYNNENPTKKVQLEDIINSVNGSSSKYDDIIKAVRKSSGTITLEMERPKIWHAALDIAAGGAIGMQFGDPEKDYVPVLGVDAEGAAPAFNAANPGNEIKAGDFIIKTDELKMDGQKMLNYLKTRPSSYYPSKITCTVWRNLPGPGRPLVQRRNRNVSKSGLASSNLI